jgi:hypothetical protein
MPQDAFADALPIAFELFLARQPAPSIALEPAVPDTAERAAMPIARSTWRSRVARS